MTLRPKKSLGQNFLVDPNQQRRIVDALGLLPGDRVLEIGPGTGALTRRIAGKVRRFVAVELDGGLAGALREELGHLPGTEIVEADALEYRPADVLEDPAAWKVVGNIPYNITTPLLFHLLERRNRPGLMVIMLQREVADRITAAPGDGSYGALSVGVRSVAAVERLFHVGRQAFRPVPDVDSTVIRILPHSPPPLSECQEADLRILTRAAFGWRRKQLRRILRSSRDYRLEPGELDRVARETGIGLERRPETLSPEDFAELAGALRAVLSERSGPDLSAD